MAKEKIIWSKVLFGVGITVIGGGLMILAGIVAGDHDIVDITAGVVILIGIVSTILAFLKK